MKLKHEDMLRILKAMKPLPSDYTDYGGEVKRWEHNDISYPDCSVGCKWFAVLRGELGADWGVCANRNAPRAGMLTFEHQAGFGCFEGEKNARR